LIGELFWNYVLPVLGALFIVWWMTMVLIRLTQIGKMLREIQRLLKTSRGD